MWDMPKRYSICRMGLAVNTLSAYIQAKGKIHLQKFRFRPYMVETRSPRIRPGRFFYPKRLNALINP